MSDEILLRLSRVKFTLHRFMMNLMEVPSDAMTSDQPLREKFAVRLASDCPDMVGLSEAQLDIRRGIFGTLSLMEMAHAEGKLSDLDFSELRNAYYFCNGNRDLVNGSVFPDGTCFRFSEQDLGAWERILHLEPLRSRVVRHIGQSSFSKRIIRTDWLFPYVSIYFRRLSVADLADFPLME